VSVRLTIVILLAAMAPRVGAQQPGVPRAFELERRGDYAGAAAAYRTVLATDPGDVAALLGLERVLLPLNRSVDILPHTRAALASDPANPAIYGVAIRAWAAADQPDSIRALAERWARNAPGDDAPYRDWGAAALARRDRNGAREAYGEGRERLGRPDALAAELAQLALADADYVTAAREWLAAVRRLPGYRATAVAGLAQAPEPARPAILGTLAADPDFMARRIEAELHARWGEPGEALAGLEEALPGAKGPAVEALKGLLDQLRLLRSTASLRTQARTLELIADRSTGPQAQRARLEAAQAYSAVGDGAGARRMLSGIEDRPTVAGDLPAGAATTLITVLAAEGKLDEARRKLDQLAPTIPGDELSELRRGLAEGYIRAGDLEDAEKTLGQDSTVEGLALAGRLRLYRGDVAGALAAFKMAGPYAGSRAEATRRTTLLAMLQPIESDSLPALGHALLRLDQGDTAAAAGELQRVGADLPPARGGAEITLLAGRLAASRGETGVAERLYRDAAAPEAPATAPAAELALAELLLSTQRTDDAVAQLEHLILTYPGSVLVPQARRLLDQARGAVPRT